jgi:hypothetical protein
LAIQNKADVLLRSDSAISCIENGGSNIRHLLRKRKERHNDLEVLEPADERRPSDLRASDVYGSLRIRGEVVHVLQRLASTDKKKLFRLSDPEDSVNEDEIDHDDDVLQYPLHRQEILRI